MGFAVERRVARDVMGNVGDVYLKLEVTVGQSGDAHGVVEVSRRFSVDGDDGEIAKISAAREFRFFHLLLLVARFDQNFIGEDVRQMMLANDYFNIHTDFTGASEDFQDASDGGEATFGITFDFDVNDSAIEFGEAHAAAGERFFFSGDAKFFAQFRGELISWRNQNFVQDARVVGKNYVALRAVAK